MHRSLRISAALLLGSPLLLSGVFRAGAQTAAQGTPGSTPIRFDLAKIPFHFEDDETPGKNAPEAMGGGIAVFDYNGDGRPDIFFTNGANIATLK
jgi:hypothetical protein